LVSGLGKRGGARRAVGVESWLLELEELLESLAARSGEKAAYGPVRRARRREVGEYAGQLLHRRPTRDLRESPDPVDAGGSRCRAPGGLLEIPSPRSRRL